MFSRNMRNMVVAVLVVAVFLVSGCIPSEFSIEKFEFGDKTLKRADDFNARIEELNTTLANSADQISGDMKRNVDELNRTINAFNRDFKVLDQATISRLDDLIAKADPIIRQLEYGVGLNQETRETVEHLIATLDNAPDDWEDTISQIIAVLNASGVDLSKSIANDLEDVLDKASLEAMEVTEWMGEETRCTLDHAGRTIDSYVGASIAEITQIKLFGVVRLFSSSSSLNQIPDQPWICHVRPDQVDLAGSEGKLIASEPIIRIIGFNFLESTLPEVRINLGNGDIAVLTNRLSRVTSYRVLLNLQGYNFSAVGVNPVITFKWPKLGETQIPLVVGNTPPVADAGDDQLQIEDTDRDGVEFLRLNGSRSHDKDGSIVEYQWKKNDALVAVGVAPQIALAVGSHILVLTIKDNRGAMDSDEVIIEIVSNPGSPPVAEAGDPQEIEDSNRDGREIVQLDGTRSYDPDEDIKSFEWRENGQLLGEGAVQSVSLLVGTHVIDLVVTDSTGQKGTDSVGIIVTEGMKYAPVAFAGEDRIVLDESYDGEEVIQLDGTGSSDPDNNILEYRWFDSDNRLLSKGIQPQLILPIGRHVIQLEVEDTDGLKGYDNIVVIVNQPPRVWGCFDNITFVFASVTIPPNHTGMVANLKATAGDPDGSIVSYQWLEGEREIATGRTAEVWLPRGNHIIVLRVTDNYGITRGIRCAAIIS